MALTYIEKQIVSFPTYDGILRKCKNLYTSKLWHQLTDKLDELILTPSCPIDFIVFEAQFIREFRKYINTLRYGSMVIEIATRSRATSTINEVQGIAFCEQALSLIEEDEKQSQTQHFEDKKVDNTQTKLLLKTQIALFELTREQADGVTSPFSIAKRKLDAVATEMADSIRACPPLIYSRYHFVCSRLWASQKKSNELPSDVSWSAMFYKHAMSYLAYTALNQIENPVTWARDIALTALVAPDFYNFGELSLHPIMKTLHETADEWVLQVVKAYIAADIGSYNKVMSKYEKEVTSNEVLQSAKPSNILLEKIRLLSLVRLAFDKSSFERIIPFKEIQQVTQCKEDAVEYLIMRAMSLTLIKGVVDEVDQNIQVTWVKPAILDIQQMEAIRKKLDVWIGQIEQTQKQVAPQVSSALQ